MKVRKNVLAWMGIVIAVLGLVGVLVSSISKWFVLIPIVVLVAALVALLKGVTFGVNKTKLPLVVAWTLVAIFAICTIIVAILFGWLALIPFVLLCSVAIWLVYLIKKSFVWIPILVLVVAVILLGDYCIENRSEVVDTLNVKTLIVENEQVDNQEVKEQKVENQEVKDQKAENQEVKEQKVENQEVKDQKVENQEVKDQKVENQEVKNQKPESKKDNSNDASNDKPQAHKHSYTSKVVAPTCTEKGYTVCTCTCGDTYKDEYKSALGHEYTSKVVAPTTTAEGYTLHTCTRCGHSYKDNYTNKIQPTVTPAIKCAETIRYGETMYVNLEGIKASNLLVSNKNFVAVEKISDTRVAITLTEDVDGYITLTDSVSRVNVVVDIQG